MSFEGYILKFSEINKYEKYLRDNHDVSSREKAYIFLSYIWFQEDFSSYSDKELIGILQNIADSNKHMSGEISSYIEFFISLENMIDKIKEELRIALKPICKELQSIPKLFNESIDDSFKNFQVQVGEAFKRLYDFFSQVDFSSLFQWIDEYIIVASEYEWVILDDMEITDVQTIVSIHNDNSYEFKEKIRLVDEIYLKYLTEEVINELFLDFMNNKRLNSMMNILGEIKFAYMNRKFYLCCVTLIPLIEGVVFDTFEGEFYCRQDKLIKRIKDLADNKLSSIVLNIFESKLFSNFRYGQELESNISRHAILHGFDRDYGNEVTFLKLLLLFNTIIEWLDASVDSVT